MRRLLTIAACTVFFACGGGGDSTSTGGAMTVADNDVPFFLTATQAQGRIIYETMCWTCHGAAGRGDGPAVAAGSIPAPPSFQAADFARSTGEQLEERFTIVGSDPKHPHMQYVSSLLKPEHFGEALSFIPALSYPPEIPGSALTGERLYDLRCVGCHGSGGHGDGPAASSLILMAPADFTTDTLIASAKWDAVFRRIREGGRAVHGSSMPPWGVILSEAQTWDLVAFLATFQPDVLSKPDWMQ